MYGYTNGLESAIENRAWVLANFPIIHSQALLNYKHDQTQTDCP